MDIGCHQEYVEPRSNYKQQIANPGFPSQITVSTAPFASSMDPKNFHDPWSFKPERWLNPKLKSLDDPEASQPFSLGPRGCMGRR